MSREKIYFAIGMTARIVLTSLFLLYFAPRYETTRMDEKLIKQDRWSGDSWQYVGNKWEKIVDLQRDWKSIDRSLLNALHITAPDIERNEALSLLRLKAPALDVLTDDELLERIKYVYAKEIMVTTYLRSFMDAENRKKAGK